MESKAIKLPIDRAMVICLRNGIKVYPEVNGRQFTISVDDNGEVTRYSKLVRPDDINAALSKTYKFWALKIINENEKS